MIPPGATGIFGGTFDPVHRGHVECLRFVLERARLETVRMVPAAVPPHKERSGVTPFEHRLAMCRRAVSGLSGITVDPIEQTLSAPCYSIGTLRALKRREPRTPFYFILGSDNLDELHTWHDHEIFIDENDFLLMRRAGYDVPGSVATLSPQAFSKVTRHVVDTPSVPIASSDIRRGLHKNPEAFRDWLDPSVYAYIRERRLYGTAPENTPPPGRKNR